MNKSYDIIFLGLARNIENTIYNFFRSIEKLSKTKQILVVIGENSSTDKTRNILENYKNKNFEFIFLKTDSLKNIKNRISRLTYGRQILKDFIDQNNFESKYISIIDLDTVIKLGFDDESFLLSLKKLEKNRGTIFGISAKSKPYYYDLLPLIIKDYFEFDVYKIQTQLKLFTIYSDRKKFIYDFQKRITKMRDVNTISSHNGLTIYFYEDYLLGNYVNEKSTKIVSEHINLNKKINQMTNKFILMSNLIQLSTPEEHMPLSLNQFSRKLISKLFFIS